MLAGCPGDDDVVDDDDDDVVEWPGAFSGQVEVVSSYDGVVACDAVIELAGSRYTGTCEGCDFAFSLDATLAVDDGSGECTLEPLWSYLPGETVVDLLFAHAPAFETHGWYGTYTFDDALLTGYSLVDGGSTTGPYWWMLAHSNSPDASFSRSGDELTWSYGIQAVVDLDPFHDDCGEIDASSADQAFGGAVVAMSELACDGTVADVWSFQGAAGATASVTIDTVADDTAFDPRFYVNTPDGCTSFTADDNFDCSFPPPSYRCPSASFETVDGGYQVVVLVAGSCAGEVAEYTLRADGVAGESLELTVDDQAVVAALDLQVTGAGTLSP